MKMPKPLRRWTRGLGVAAALLAPMAPAQAQQPGAKGVTTVAPETGTVLPFEPFRYTGNVGRTLADSDAPQFPKLVRPPKGAPNVVLILIDDAGYGQFGTFGGQVPTPALDSVAKQGLRYTRFHTTALCSPTRAALLTGRNHHSTGNGVITEAATGYDGYTGIIGKDVGTIAEVLRQHGYATSWFGKNHNTPDWETSVVGPFDRWPSGLGFDYFYGFMGGDMDQWQPTLYENHNLVPRSTDPDYILTKDLVDKSIAWLRQTRSIDAEKPFFLYMATGATHAPHHVRPEFIAKFKGQFDAGWDVYREQTFERQKQLGVVPPNTMLTPRPKELPAWDSLSANQKRLFARMMEVFAGFTAETDHEMGRLLEVVRSLPDADNTIVLYQVGDNGASAEGGLVGLLNENSFFNGVPESLEENLKAHRRTRRAEALQPLPRRLGVGDEHALPVDEADRLAPRRCAQSARHLVAGADHGQGRRAAAVPSRHRHRADDLRSVRHHVSDDAQRRRAEADRRRLDGLFVRLGESAGAPPQPIFRDVRQPRPSTSDGWWAASRTGIPWESGPAKPIDPDTATWELYNLDEDFSQANDLAEKNPGKLRELQDQWWAAAARYNVLPLDGRKTERLNAELQGRPSLAGNRTASPTTRARSQCPRAAHRRF